MTNIAMVSDFFFPRVGGVEQHIFSLSQQLTKLGHKVIIITIGLDFQDLQGIRYISDNIKVYYMPIKSMVKKPYYLSYATFTGQYLQLIRDIFIKEKIQIVHGHTQTSTTAMNAMYVAYLLQIPYIYTQHSLHDTDSTSDNLISSLYCVYNQLFIHKVICVSKTVQENLIIRCEQQIEDTKVIPNGIDIEFYQQTNSQRETHEKITLIVLSRLTDWKGIDFLLQFIPVICQKYPQVQFQIFGDGSKKPLLLKLINKFNLSNQVLLGGFLKTYQVPQIFSQGDIFMNLSITEAFCIANLEASSCGIYILSTDVGGVAEVLPQENLTLVKPQIDAIIQALINIIDNKTYLRPINSRPLIGQLYNWQKIAQETEKVYQETLDNFKPKRL